MNTTETLAARIKPLAITLCADYWQARRERRDPIKPSTDAIKAALNGIEPIEQGDYNQAARIACNITAALQEKYMDTRPPARIRANLVVAAAIQDIFPSLAYPTV